MYTVVGEGIVFHSLEVARGVGVGAIEIVLESLLALAVRSLLGHVLDLAFLPWYQKFVLSKSFLLSSSNNIAAVIVDVNVSVGVVGKRVRVCPGS